ncbi:MAG: hypothetical protein AB7T06_35235 [Kofleriaceae bacterium]
MANLQSDIQRLVDGFVAQVTELARRAAITTLESALGGSRGGAGAGLRIGRGRGRGAKRTGEELEKLSDEFLAFVAKNPGLRIEQINKQLGTTTKDLALPIRKMIADGTLKVKGKKRSTAYFPGKAKN